MRAQLPGRSGLERHLHSVVDHDRLRRRRDVQPGPHTGRGVEQRDVEGERGHTRERARGDARDEQVAVDRDLQAAAVDHVGEGCRADEVRSHKCLQCADGPAVSGTKRHQQIVRVLQVDERRAAVTLACLKQLR